MQDYVRSFFKPCFFLISFYNIASFTNWEKKLGCFSPERMKLREYDNDWIQKNYQNRQTSSPLLRLFGVSSQQVTWQPIKPSLLQGSIEHMHYKCTSMFISPTEYNRSCDWIWDASNKNYYSNVRMDYKHFLNLWVADKINTRLCQSITKIAYVRFFNFKDMLSIFSVFLFSRTVDKVYSRTMCNFYTDPLFLS